MSATQIASSGRFRMGDLDLDVDERRLTRHGRDLKLSNLTFKLLYALTSAAPALVTKDELADQVWNGRAVSPETIAQRIKLLRVALHDQAHAPRYIEVVCGQGYRWIPDVVVVPRNRPNYRNALDTTTSHENVSLELPDQPSVVVLPLNTLGDEQLEHRILADGLTHDIITSVGRAHWLFVVARGSAFMFRGGNHFVQDVGHRLGVRYVVQGSIAFSGQKISVNISLADTVFRAGNLV